MSRRRWSRLWRTTALGVLVCFGSTVLPTWAVPACSAETCTGKETPEGIYRAAEGPEEALRKLSALIDRASLSGACLRDAYIFKARCETELGNRAAAENSFCRALAVDAGWRPDPKTYTTADMDAFSAALRRCAPRKLAAPPLPPPVGATAAPPKKKSFLLAAGGAVAAGALVMILLGGGKKTATTPQPIPGFPAPPN